MRVMSFSIRKEQNLDWKIKSFKKKIRHSSKYYLFSDFVQQHFSCFKDVFFQIKSTHMDINDVKLIKCCTMCDMMWIKPTLCYTCDKKNDWLAKKLLINFLCYITAFLPTFLSISTGFGFICVCFLEQKICM